MTADFYEAFVNQIRLAQHQVRLPHSFFMSASVGMLSSVVYAYPGCISVK